MAAAIAKVVGAGAKGAASVAEAVKDADVVITMLPAGPHVRKVYADDILPNAPKTALLIDCSTIAPATSRRLAQRLADLHVAAELPQAPHRVMNGGGDAKAIDRHMRATTGDLAHGEGRVGQLCRVEGDVGAQRLGPFLPLKQRLPRGLLSQLCGPAAKVLLDDAAALSEALSAQVGHTVRVRRAQRGLAARWAEMTRDNAVQALRMRLARSDGWADMYADLALLLGRASPPTRMECFDISHTRGEAPVASCVVFGPEGARKTDYRRFNIEGTNRGLSTFEDQHYAEWPNKLNEAERSNGWYLRSLTSSEEFAVFLM